MDDEHQITIGLDKNTWPILQEIANQTANEKKWLGGRGNDYEHLNIWLIGRLSNCPRGVEPHQWISKAID